MNEKKLVSKGWRTATICLIVLSVLLFASLVGLFVAGSQALNNEYECAYNVCEKYSSYNYDSVSKMCYCFEYGVVIKKQHIS